MGTRLERTRGGRRGGIVRSAAEAGLVCGGVPEPFAGPDGAGEAVLGREGGGGGSVGAVSVLSAYLQHRDQSG